MREHPRGVADLRKQADVKTVLLHGKIAAGRVALVDDEDYDLVMAHSWHVREQRRPDRNRLDGPYALTNITRDDGKGSTIGMHKLITGWPQTDHVDHDGLNNQRHNLRPATRVQNLANTRPRLGCTSQFKGVHWYASRNLWAAYIRTGGRLRRLGYFTVEEDAARAYDVAALAAWGEYAYPNFPSP